MSKKPDAEIPERIKRLRIKSRRVVKYGPDNPRPPPKSKVKKKRRLSEFHRQALKERKRARNRERNRQRQAEATRLGLHRAQPWLDDAAWSVLCDLKAKTGMSASAIINTLLHRATVEGVSGPRMLDPAAVPQLDAIRRRVAELKGETP